MNQVKQTFDERLNEIEAYIDLLDALEVSLASGAPAIGGRTITAQQQKILYSSVYLQLYNLVEATATWCIEAVASASVEQSRWSAADLSDKIRREWVRSTARTHVELSSDNRLEATVKFCDLVMASAPLTDWSIEKGGGGNWDDREIQSLCERLGLQLAIPPEVLSAVKRVIRDDKNALGLVKYLRNKLAHGGISFAECGDGVTAKELRELKETTAAYLKEVVRAFSSFVSQHGFIVLAKRPAGVAAC